MSFHEEIDLEVIDETLTVLYYCADGQRTPVAAFPYGCQTSNARAIRQLVDLRSLALIERQDVITSVQNRLAIASQVFRDLTRAIDSLHKYPYAGTYHGLNQVHRNTYDSLPQCQSDLWAIIKRLEHKAETFTTLKEDVDESRSRVLLASKQQIPFGLLSLNEDDGGYLQRIGFHDPRLSSKLLDPVWVDPDYEEWVGRLNRMLNHHEYHIADRDLLRANDAMGLTENTLDRYADDISDLVTKVANDTDYVLRRLLDAAETSIGTIKQACLHASVIISEVVREQKRDRLLRCQQDIERLLALTQKYLKKVR